MGSELYSLRTPQEKQLRPHFQRYPNTPGSHADSAGTSDKQRQHAELRPEERPQLVHETCERHSCDDRRHEQQPADRRGDHPHRQVDDHDNAELQVVDAERVRDRREDRREHDDPRQRLDENAEHEQQEVHGKEERERRQLHPDDPLSQILRHARHRQHPRERGRHANDDQYRRGHQRGACEDARQHPPFERPVHDATGEERVEHGDDRSLGGRERTRRNPAEDQHGQHQRGQRPPGVARVIPPLKALKRAAVISPHRDCVVDDGHRHGDDDSGHCTSDQQADEIHLRIRERVNDHADRWRNDRAENRRRCGQCSRIFGLVTVVTHHPDHDRARPGRVGERRARNAGEECQRQDVGVAHPAAKPSDELRGEAQQHRRQFTAGHQFGGQYEKWHRLQREQIDAGEKVLRQRDQRHLPRPHGDQRRPAQREGDGNADREQRDAGDEKNGHHQSFTASASNSPSPSNSRRATNPRAIIAR